MFTGPIDNQHWHDPKAIANHILWMRRDAPTTPLKLVKLVYICHGWMLGLTSEELINEPVEAWQNGPVVPSLYWEYRRFGGYPIEVPIAEQPLTDNQVKVIEAVHDVYKDFSGPQLSELTHRNGTPWHEIYYKDGVGAVIPSSIIRNHYRTVLGVDA